MIRFKTSSFLQELTASLPFDGVLLIMHGAMHVPSLEDPEGDWIAAVRTLVGPNVPIAVSYDLHGNVTQRIVDQIDIFCAYRTAPHIDVKETHQRAADHLVDQLRGGPRRCVAYAPVPVLLPGEKTSTEDEPTKSLYARLADYDDRTGISDANLMVGYVWADTPRATAASVVTGTDQKAVLAAANEISGAYWEARTRFNFGVPTKSLSDCLDDAAAAATLPFILADSGDNPTGGGVGDRADILKAWLDRGLKDAVFAGIADPLSVERAWPFEIWTHGDAVHWRGLGQHLPGRLHRRSVTEKRSETPPSGDRGVDGRDRKQSRHPDRTAPPLSQSQRLPALRDRAAGHPLSCREIRLSFA